MSLVESFLSQQEESDIIEAIRNAEKNTSGEIRIHLEENTEKPPMDRAREVFFLLEMDKTAQKNGILFYINVLKKQFAILGDSGIDQAVPHDFWNDEKDILYKFFSQNEYKEGLVKAILKAGEKLKEFFPHQSDDINELSDEISKG